MSTYLGFDVLDQVNHNMREPIAQSFDRLGQRIESPVGRGAFEDFAGEPMPVRSFDWFAPNRAAVAVLRTFLDARLGRLVPFWAPTYARELVLSQDSAVGQASIRVYRVGYGATQFAFPARRHLALVAPGGTFQRRKVTLVVDNGDGTETLSLDTALTADVSAASTLLSFLTLNRLEEDRTPIVWFHAGAGEARLRFREVPKEVPA